MFAERTAENIGACVKQPYKHKQRKQVELATQHYDVTQNRYNNGLALLTDMLDASNMKLSADMHLVNAQINLIYNYYKLKFDTSSL